MKNFMNLPYAKWLRLPIKQLPEPRPVLNIDGTENKSGKLKYYTDLNIRTGQNTITLWFFLSDLGEHKVILGYPWFAATQPRIDWKKGWIDHSQLPIVLRAPNTQKQPSSLEYETSHDQSEGKNTTYAESRSTQSNQKTWT